MFIVFDLLAEDRGRYLEKNLNERRKLLAKFAKKNFKSNRAVRLSPATADVKQAKKWFDKVGGDLDGVIAKRLDMPYRSGERDAALKIKQIRSADCVVGGFRYASGSKILGSLLLGLYEDGLLNHVGFTSAFKTDERRALTKKFEVMRKPPGFTGNAPGGPSRWSTERTGEWEPVEAKIVVEVAYDHFTGGRFRHGTKILRWRNDKAPKQCTFDQVAGREGKSLATSTTILGSTGSHSPLRSVLHRLGPPGALPVNPGALRSASNFFVSARRSSALNAEVKPTW